MQTLIGFIAVAAVYALVVSIFFQREVKAVFERDPAATNYWEVIFTYPGLHAIMAYRIAHQLLRMRVPFFPRWISQTARWATGIEIHQGAKIGDGLFIDHGMGVVVGETTIIGNNVTLFQGVTLGGTGKEHGKRHPTLGNNIVVGTGAKVLGNIVIGDNVAIGANAVVLRDVPPNSTVVGVPGRIAKQAGRRVPGANLDYTSLPDPLTERLERLQREIDLIESHLKEWHEEQRQATGQSEQPHRT